MFWRKRHRQSQTLTEEMNNHFQEISHRFSQLEQSLDQLRTNATHITIENVHIHQPVLEKMEYRLESLDIEQLSGSLNLGNNFGAKLRTNPSSKQPNMQLKTDIAVPSIEQKQKKADPAPMPPEDVVSGLQRTHTGYRLTRS